MIFDMIDQKMRSQAIIREELTLFTQSHISKNTFMKIKRIMKDLESV
jgi:hypothetical protein